MATPGASISAQDARHTGFRRLDQLGTLRTAEREPHAGVGVLDGVCHEKVGEINKSMTG